MRRLQIHAADRVSARFDILHVPTISHGRDVAQVSTSAGPRMPRPRTEGV